MEGGEKALCSHKDLYTNVHPSCICNSQKLLTKQLSKGEWINKLWYIHAMDILQQQKGTNYWHTQNIYATKNK